MQPEQLLYQHNAVGVASARWHARDRDIIKTGRAPSPSYSPI
jgi:hypothetical protein